MVNFLLALGRTRGLRGRYGASTQRWRDEVVAALRAATLRRPPDSELILIEACSQRLLPSRMLSRVVLALLLIDPAASLVLPVSSPVAHGVRRAPAPVAFDLKKM